MQIIDKEGHLTVTRVFPFRIDRDSVSRGVAYGSWEFIDSLLSAARLLHDGGWLAGERDWWAHIRDLEELTRQRDHPMRIADRLEEMMEAACPPGIRFGTNEGDSTDFCFWAIEEEDAHD